MNQSLRSNPHGRIIVIGSARCVAVLALLAPFVCACRSFTEHEIALAVSAQGLPGAGAGLELSQLMLERGAQRIDFELGVERQKLADEGPEGDDWTRIWAGLRCADQSCAGLQGHAGVTWLRSEGHTSYLADPGDYGGVYVGAGWMFALAPGLGMGPDIDFLYVDSEGDRSGSGGVVELAWRWVWYL